jgi:hypothetical protein
MSLVSRQHDSFGECPSLRTALTRPRCLATRRTRGLTSSGFLAAISSFIEILSFSERPSFYLNSPPFINKRPVIESDSSTIDCG